MNLAALWARAMTRGVMGLSSLQRRLMPPQFAIMSLATQLWPALGLRAAVVSGLIDRLERAPASADEAAADLHLRPSPVYRLLRFLAGYDVVRECRDGRFALTRIGRRAAVTVPGNASAFVRYVGEPWQLEPWARLDETLRTGAPAFDAIFGVPFFEYARERAEVRRIFDEAMRSVAELHAQAVARAYDFGSAQVVVDVGGGTGSVLGAILRRYPQVRGVLFDSEEVVAGASVEEFSERASVEAGDFFTLVPSKGSIYLLSHILHDWDDEQALRLLRNVRKELNPGALVLIVECILGERDNRWDQGKVTDVQMLATLSGRERTRKEFERLIAAASLRINRVVPTISAESVIECIGVP